MIKEIIQACQRGVNGIGFNEVVLMLSNQVSTAEVYTNLDDVRFSETGNIVTFMADSGSHLHMDLDKLSGLKFRYVEKNERGEPSYSIWFLDKDDESVFRIYLRKSEVDATNLPRHELFMGLIEQYGENVTV